MTLPPLEQGPICPDCGQEMAFPDFCGECEERRREHMRSRAMHDMEAEQ